MQKLKAEVRDVHGTGLCVMFDGWTDNHKKHPYLGLRIAYINSDWMYRVMTVSCRVVERHTGIQISDHVRQELDLIGVDIKKLQLFSAHDGAANMMKASRLLHVSDIQHRLAHALHLLLMTDEIGRSPEIQDLLNRCQTAISKLLFKPYLVQDEVDKSADREVMNALYDS